MRARGLAGEAEPDGLCAIVGVAHDIEEDGVSCVTSSATTPPSVTYSFAAYRDKSQPAARCRRPGCGRALLARSLDCVSTCHMLYISTDTALKLPAINRSML